jgi:hypothetical protein
MEPRWTLRRRQPNARGPLQAEDAIDPCLLEGAQQRLGDLTTLSLVPDLLPLALQGTLHTGARYLGEKVLLVKRSFERSQRLSCVGRPYGVHRTPQGLAHAHDLLQSEWESRHRARNDFYQNLQHHINTICDTWKP